MSEAAAAEWQFRKITDPSIRTRYLFLGNVGPGVGVSQATLDELLQPFRPETVVVPFPTAPFVFVVFASVEDAAHATEELEARSVQLLGRKVVAKYSDAKQTKAQPATIRPVAFTAADLGVPGIELYPEFITPEEEQAYLAAVSEGTWIEMVKRRVQHYGWDFDYVARTLGERIGPLPDWIQPLAQRAAQIPAVNQSLDQMTVNEYTPGVGLSWHVDNHSAFTGAIVSVSLASDCVMAFRRNGDQRELLLPRRSLLVISGEARYAWEHQIPNRKYDDLGVPPTTDNNPLTPIMASLTASATSQDTNTPALPPHMSPPGPSPPIPNAYITRANRISLTLRQARGFACDCPYPDMCDTRQGGPIPTRLGMLRAKQAAEGTPTTNVPPASSDTHTDTVAHSQQAQHDGTGNGVHTQSSACSSHVEPNNNDASHQQSTGNGCVGHANGQGANGDRASALGTEGARGEACGQSGLANGGQGHDDDRDDRAAELFESEHVHAVYDAIAPHFDVTRFSVWPKVSEFIHSLPAGSLVADVGCGNGKYFGVRSDILTLGSDRSAGLTEVAAKRLRPHTPTYTNTSTTTPTLRADVLQADGFHLPYRDQSCDAVICIAVLHHISSVARRKRLIGEMLRVLRLGGRAFVTVWAAEQEEPKKTLDKWTRIPTPAPTHGARAHQGATHTASDVLAAPQAASNGHADADVGVQERDLQGERVVNNGDAGTGQPQPQSQQPQEQSQHQQQPGPDYMVPWHMPLPQPRTRRRGAAPTAAAAPAATNTTPAPTPEPPTDTAHRPPSSAPEPQSVSEGQQGGQTGFSSHLGPAKAKASSTVCADKPLVVYQRYYHLFVAGELEALVDEVPGCRRVGQCYDKSNWCVAFERTE